MTVTRTLVGVAAGLAITSIGWAQQEDENPRRDLEKMERALSNAVARVSRPAVVPMLGAAELCRGYRLQGVGAWFVVAPRAFPDRTARSRQDPDLVKADEELATAIAGLHRGVKAARSDEERQTLTTGIQQLTHRRRDLRARAHAASERERELKAWEERAAAMHAAAKDARLEAQRAIEVLERMSPALEIQEENAPGATRPTAAEVKDALPPLPPWRLWVQADVPEETRTADVVLSDVREAITRTLEDHGARLPLSAGEMIAVAVDFFNPTALACSKPPARTLVVRAPRSVLEALATGELARGEARKRFEILEY